MFLFCLAFAVFCARLFICALWSPAGKGLTSWLLFVVSSVSLSLSHWCPGSGVVLDCVDSWSLHHYLLLWIFQWKVCIQLELTDINIKGTRGATIRQKAYCDILRYGKPVLRYILRYTWYLHFCLLLPLVQYYYIIQGPWNWHILHTVIFSATPSVHRLLFKEKWSNMCLPF